MLWFRNSIVEAVEGVPHLPGAYDSAPVETQRPSKQKQHGCRWVAIERPRVETRETSLMIHN